MLAYNALREHMCCSCHCDGEHLTRLLLRPPPLQNTAHNGHVQFDMLFSARAWKGAGSGHWQDVQLLVPRAKRSKKRARILSLESNDDIQPLPSPPEPLSVRVDHGQFCKLISSETRSRVCLTVHDGKLHKTGFDHLRQIVQHAPGISLANLLRIHHLSARMKVTLAYILAQSVWQYYDSDWMKTAWTSETIQFIEECAGEQGGIFAFKPYLSVRFGDEEDPLAGERSTIDGEIHHYPRVRALGTMLVEIGIGSPLPMNYSARTISSSVAAAVNEHLLQAIQHSKNERLWRDCDYPDYLAAVSSCLHPCIFGSATSMPAVGGEGEEPFIHGLKRRRDILYDKVVFPLEELLQRTRWMDQLTSISPLETPTESVPAHGVVAEQLPSPAKDADDAGAAPPAQTDPESKRKARRWLLQMRRLNHELAAAQAKPISPAARVRIAVLDTGCDDNAAFFLHSDHGSRLQEWKDWVDESEQWQDQHGHGTHLVSLIMQIAPDALMYVARVARSPDELLGASDNVAKAISWASKEWRADIISMSFGYAEEQRNISRAIRGALYERDDAVLFFAAASNYGANEREMFPARHDSVISIRCTNFDGDFEGFNPARSQDEETAFGTLGMDVPSSWLSTHHQAEEYKSGSSVAAAVAAAMAAGLLGYAGLRSGGCASLNVAEKLRTRKGMLAVFRALATPTLKERYLYLAPWKWMEGSDEVRWATLVAALSRVC
ncbi:hypothetical protein JDV02_006159 [Purpureocillium takamizusanense]|nr:uncharacterized protein JDV02_006159 [Purpureocillium takamizusanense]UNI20026.1 hypothetical protein JDV02_006159 [Purpureocillium takamizusanense]